MKLPSAAVAAVVLLAARAEGHDRHDDVLAAVRFDQKLDAQTPGDVQLVDEHGALTNLRALMAERPTVLSFAYYSCGNLCPLVLGGLARAAAGAPPVPGKDYTLLTVSIDPKDMPADARREKGSYLARTGKSDGADWRFVTGSASEVKRLAASVGFAYAYDEAQRQYAHPAGVVVLTATGRVSRYLYGLTFPPRDLRLALGEASAGTIGSPVDQLLLRCFHYDPVSGRYSLVVLEALRIGGGLTAGGMLLSLAWAFRKRSRA